MVTASSGTYHNDHLITLHRHSRAQLLNVQRGLVMVSTPLGRWLVPPDHAMWIPAGVEHSVEMLGDVRMRSIYIDPTSVSPGRDQLTVLAMTELMNALATIAVEQDSRQGSDPRTELAMQLLVIEIAHLPLRQLVLPLPQDERLAKLCLAFIANPESNASIDIWAGHLGMSRRTFTRFFRQQMGGGLSAWRQQACLFAALPRLSAGEPVTVVAMDVGYSTIAAFTAMFTRTMGISPRSYVKISGIKQQADESVA